MIIKLNKPFMVISKVTDFVYKIDTIEINDKGKIINYIIDHKVWNPSRFRSKTYLEEDENIKNVYTGLCNKQSNNLLNKKDEIIQKLKRQLEEKDKLINEILSYGWFDGDCPASITGEDLNYCENCMDNYKQCWLDYFKNKVKDSEENVKKS